MLLATLSPIDYGVLVLYLAGMVMLGVYFSARQKDTAEFFLGSRSFSWFPLGLSLMATLVSALTYTGLPGQAYDQGLKCWIIPLAYWLILPILVYLVIPIYRGLGLYSLYEYLEHRFDPRVRLAGTLIFVVWRLLWLGGVLYAPCKVLLLASGWNVPDWMLLVPLGILTTLYTFLGGMRAVIWTDVIQGVAMLFGIVIVIGVVWMSLDGGPQRVVEMAHSTGRMQAAEFDFRWTSQWTLWGALPHWILAALSFYVADQITAQRFLSAKSVNAARTSYLINTLALSFMLPGLVYIGLSLLTYYHQRPEELRPQWVVNIDGQTRQPVTRPGTGEPLLDPRRPEDAVTWENIDRLVAEGRILRPNSKEPFTSSEELIDPETNRIRVERLAMRRPSEFGGEIVISQAAREEMLPHFIATRLSWGAAGIILAALLAGAMSSIDSGLNSICTLVVMDLHRRYGLGKRWLAGRLGKQPDDLTEVDELQLARPLTIVIGLAATAFSLLIARIGDIYLIMVGVANTFGAPLLAVFLLGMLTRRTTAAAALVATVAGGLFTVGLTAANKLASLDVVLPREYAFAEIWNVVFGTIFTFSLGYALSFVLGRRKTNVELRGLVAGCGTLGVRATDEEHPLISLPGEEDNPPRWK